MTREHKTEVLVGLTVTAALLILVAGIYWGRDASVFSERHYLTVRFEDVSGLEDGDPVLIRGIPCGQVDGIFLKSDHVEVELWVACEFPLYSDLRVQLQSQELMGGKKIVVLPGESGDLFNVSSVIFGESVGDLMMLMARAEDILIRADSSFVRINRFLARDRLNTLMDDFEVVLKETHLAVSENRKAFRTVIGRLNSITEQFDSDSTAARMSLAVAQMDTTLSLMKSITMRLESEEGTLGKLLRDRWLYDQLLKTSLDLDSLITDLKANPKKYVKFSLF